MTHLLSTTPNLRGHPPSRLKARYWTRATGFAIDGHWNSRTGSIRSHSSFWTRRRTHCLASGSPETERLPKQVSPLVSVWIHWQQRWLYCSRFEYLKEAKDALPCLGLDLWRPRRTPTAPAQKLEQVRCKEEELLAAAKSFWELTNSTSPNRKVNRASV